MPIIHVDIESIGPGQGITISSPLSGIGGAVGHAAASSSTAIASNVVPSYVASGAANILHTFLNIFYYNYHFYPEKIDAGYVATNVSYPAKLWNAWFAPKTLDAVNIIGDPGTTTTLVPGTLAALEEASFTITISARGASKIDAGLEAIFGSDTVSLPITGLRAVFLDLSHNWATRLSENIEFKTDIIRLYDGHEQRRALRLEPRLRLTIRTTEWPPSVTQRLLHSHQAAAVLIPHHRYQATVVKAAPPGQTVEVDAIYPWMRHGTTVDVIKDAGERAQLIIDSVDAINNTIRFTVPFNFTIPADSPLRLLLVAQPAMNIRAALLGSNILDAPLSFSIQEGFFPWWPTSMPNDYLGYAVFDPPFDWRSRVQLTSDILVDIVDFGVGRTSASPHLAKSFLEWRITFKSIALPHVEWLQDFFRAARGMAKSFWWPSHHEEIQLASAPRLGDGFLRVPGQDFYAEYRNDPFRKHILVRRTSGQKIIFAVQDIIPVNDTQGQDTHIVLDRAFTEDINDLQSVEWLYRARFGSDILAIKWETDNVFTVTTGIRILHAP